MYNKHVTVEGRYLGERQQSFKKQTFQNRVVWRLVSDCADFKSN